MEKQMSIITSPNPVTPPSVLCQGNPVHGEVSPLSGNLTTPMPPQENQAAKGFFHLFLY